MFTKPVPASSLNPALINSLFSRVIGTNLPNSIYLSQTIAVSSLASIE
jgi:hypothetical protein